MRVTRNSISRICFSRYGEPDLKQLESKRMNRKALASVKRLCRNCHLWLGLFLGGIWALQGLTGALLVFHREADRLMLAPAAAPPRLSLDKALKVAERQAPARITSIGIIDSSTAVISANYLDENGRKRALLLETASGRVLTDRELRPVAPGKDNVTRWLYNLHHELLSGEPGAYLLGSSGLFLGVSCIWGVWLAWPSRRAWTAVIKTASWRTLSQRLYGWHRLLGLGAAPLLLVLVLSGASMDFSKQIRTFATSTLPYREAYKTMPGPVRGKVVGADRAVALAQEQLPQAAFVSLSLPENSKPVYQVRMRQPGEWRSWSGTSAVTVHPVSGVVLDVYDAAAAPLANRVLESAFAFHSGEAIGLRGRFTVFLAGLSLPILYGLGVWSWLRRRKLSQPSRSGQELVDESCKLS